MILTHLVAVLSWLLAPCATAARLGAAIGITWLVWLIAVIPLLIQGNALNLKVTIDLPGPDDMS